MHCIMQFNSMLVAKNIHFTYLLPYLLLHIQHLGFAHTLNCVKLDHVVCL